MNALYLELQWLPRSPRDFLIRLKSGASEQEALGTHFQKLAASALDVNQLMALARAIERAHTQGRSLRPLTPFHLGILSNGTTDLLIPALIASAARYGIALEVIQSSFAHVAQEALSPDSRVNRSRPDAVLFAIDYRALPLHISPGDAGHAAATVAAAMEYLQGVVEGIRSHSGALCILQTCAPPVELLFGSLDRGLPGTMSWLLDRLNRDLTAYAVSSGNVLLDAGSIAETVGLAEWHDTQLWNLARIPFADQYLPLYADHVARVVAAIRGRSRKALILDLDNTVWGGVIGDDGFEGISVAQGDARGEAFRTVQQMALELRRRGIVLAVCSKNEDAIARAPFQSHPEMLLRLDDIAVFQANWEDKATNIKAIAEELSLGLDAMVFLDDNPAEREIVRHLLPDVAVPELPEEPAFYARTLAAAGYFEAVTFAGEDLGRADFYQDNARRARLRTQTGALDAYLESLEMTITFEPFSTAGRARIVQLLNKTNQYNLTGRRYLLPEVIAAENDPKVFTMQVRLADRFGDNGMISVIICRLDASGVWDIDTWLMSCRVLGRRVEYAVLRQLLEQARYDGVHTLRGTYQPTERNQLVSDHYARLGFTRVDEQESGLTHWELRAEECHVESVPMRVISLGFPTGDRAIA